MSEQITGSTPKIYYRGTKDTKATRGVGGSPTLPLHRPLIMFFGQQGDTTPRWVDPAKFSDIYGADTLDLNGIYATHSTPFLQEAIAAGNQFLAMKLESADIPAEADLGLSVDWLETDIPEYQRNADGSYKLDQNNGKIPTGSNIPGIKLKFIFAAIGADVDGVSLFGKRVEKAGTLGGESSGASTITPLLDFKARSKGSRGGNTALRIWAPTSNSAQAADPDLQTTLKNFLYRFQLLTRTDKNSSPSIVQSYYDDTSLSVALGTNVIDPNTEVVYDFAERVESRYNDTDPSTYFASPISQPGVYDTFIAKILGKIQVLEAPYGLVTDDADDLYEINLFGGQTVDAIPYHAVQIMSVAEGGESLSETASHYLAGGGDGTLGNAAFNTAANLVLSNINNSTVLNLANMARYPFNAFWDSGFDLPTKLLIPSLIGFRADTWIALSTQDITLDNNTAEEEESIAVSLLNRVQQFPDSSDFATPAFRGMIVGEVGEYTETTRKLRVPLTLDRFRVWCRYAGASDGILKSAESIDGDTNRKVQIVKNISNLDKSWRTKRTMWNSGLVYVEDYDTASQFYPGQQSFYSIQGSTLSAAFTGFLVANINRFAYNAWRDLSGQQTLTDAQLIERSEKIVTDAGASAFDNRLIYTPVAMITDDDKARGYSWSMRVDFGANAFRTVLDFSTVAYTREELAANG